MNTTDDAVGYGNPPKKHRFKKGQSGNPSGRPKAKPTLRQDIEEELAESTTTEEGGTGTTITKSRAIAKTLIEAAIRGDVRATNMILSLAEKISTRDVEPPTSPEEDKEVVADFLERKSRK